MHFVALTLLLFLGGCSPSPPPEPSSSGTPGAATIQPVGNPTPLGTP